MNKSFTLVEVLIVVAILGILAAIVLPQFQSHTQQARESAAKENLRILRNAIELYAARHNGVPPGYPHNDPGQETPHLAQFMFQMLTNEHYINVIPENPFNGYSTLRIIGNEEQLPAEATGEFGWIYKAATKTIKLDWPGTDSAGALYFDY
jgi:prepilin-type N-terminal cleavage/methylation domain-containing protein